MVTNGGKDCLKKGTRSARRVISNLPYWAMRRGFTEEETHELNLKGEYIYYLGKGQLGRG